jgi:hypothetical protein
MGMTTDQWREFKRSNFDDQADDDIDEYCM